MTELPKIGKEGVTTAQLRLRVLKQREMDFVARGTIEINGHNVDYEGVTGMTITQMRPTGTCTSSIEQPRGTVRRCVLARDHNDFEKMSRSLGYDVMHRDRPYGDPQAFVWDDDYAERLRKAQACTCHTTGSYGCPVHEDD